MHAVFSNPGFVLAGSGSFFSEIKSFVGFVGFDVFNCLSEIGFSLSESFDGIASQFGVSSFLSNMIVDIGVQVGGDLVY